MAGAHFSASPLLVCEIELGWCWWDHHLLLPFDDHRRRYALRGGGQAEEGGRLIGMLGVGHRVLNPGSVLDFDTEGALLDYFSQTFASDEDLVAADSYEEQPILEIGLGCCSCREEKYGFWKTRPSDLGSLFSFLEEGDNLKQRHGEDVLPVSVVGVCIVRWHVRFWR